MTGTKQRSVYRKRTFGGVKKQDLPIFAMQSTESNDTDTIAPSSPAKKNCSFEKINRNCPLIESEILKVHTRKMKIELGLGNEFTKQYCAMP